MSIDLAAFAPRRVLEHDLLSGGEVLSQPATVLFVDLEGFTDLTGRLGAHGSRGTEQLSGLLRTFFGTVTDEVTARGGDPIGFGGDALTFVFDGPAGPALEAARASGAAIHRIAEDISGAATLAGPVALRTRIGIARGPVATAVARAAGRAVPVHLGPGLDLAEAAQAAVAAGEVAVDASALEEVADAAPPPVVRRGADAHLSELVSPWILDRLDADPESHRRITATFVRFPPPSGDGAEAMSGFVAGIDRLLALVAESEGEVVQVSGGDKGVVGLVVHGAPMAHADDPVRAAETALRLREGSPEIAAGVATGPVFAALLGSRTRVFPTHFGLSVTTAARLMQAATPGQVLLDPATWAGAHARLRSTGEPQVLALKGHPAPVEVHDVAGWADRAPAPGAATRPPLVGRHAEIDAIEGLLDRATDGRRAVLTIVGEPGLGKTRLVQEATERAETRGFTVLRADVDGSRGRKQTVWRDLLGPLLEGDSEAAWPRSLRPLLGGADESGDRVAALRADADLDAELAAGGVASFLADHGGPWLIAVDDAHRLDDFSAAVVSALTASSTQAQAAVLLTRDRDDAAGGAIVLGELTATESAQVATDAWRLAGGGSAPGWLGDLVTERAGANPLFVRTVTETVQASWQAGSPPPTLDSTDDPEQALTGLLRERVDRLPPRDQALLGALAVLDAPSRPDTLQAVLPDHDDVAATAARLTAEHLVEVVPGDDGDRLRLRHRVLRDVVHASMSHAERDRAHRAVVDVLASAAADPVEIAEHVRHLDDPDLVRRWFPLAAEAARRTWSFPQAAAYLEAARPLVSGPERARLDADLLEVLLVAGRATDVLALADESPDADDTDDPDNPALRARRLHAVVEAAFTSGDLARAEAAGRELMDATDGHDEARYQRAAELVVLATCALGHPDAAVEEAHALVVRAEATADPRALTAAEAALGAALLIDDRPEEAEPHYLAALAAARGTEDVVAQVHVLSDLAGCAYERGDHATCVQRLGEARALADQVGYRRHLVVSLTNEALLRAAVGDPFAAACAELAVGRSLDLGDLPTAISALDAWLSSDPGLAADPIWWRRLADLDLSLSRPQVEAGHRAEEALAAARRGLTEEADGAAAVAATAADEPAVGRRVVLARALMDDAPDAALAALDRLLADAAEDEDPVELAEIALERWRLSGSDESRLAASDRLAAAFAEQPTLLVRSWYDELGVAHPDGPEPLPPPVGIGAAGGGRDRLAAAVDAVEQAAAARQTSEKNAET